ncbi:MAG: HEAT repeat domain-containing protein [Planctomycetota bacterium]|jgi:hypothetical protein
MRGSAVWPFAAAVALLALMPISARAQDPADSLSYDEVQEIAALVEELGASSIHDRLHAQKLLGAYGRRAVPLLRALNPEDPEVRMRIRALLKQFERIELTARLTSAHHALGAPVLIVLKLTNHTRNSYLLPISRNLLTPFRVTISGKGRFLKTDEVTFSPEQKHAVVTIAPGASLIARAAIGPEDLPRRRAGSYEVIATYASRQVLRLANSKSEGMTVEGDPDPLNLAAPPLKLDLYTRTPAQLDAALADPRQRQRALVELRFRDDEDILPLLRRHARDPDIRLHAIRRLGTHRDVSDLDLIRAATKDRSAAVRVAATLALANFHVPKARRTLRGLAGDAELGLHAVKALTQHKHPRTIDTYVLLLRSKYREGPAVPIIQKALEEWTDKTVKNSPTEIAAFERWWRANRAEWTRRNLPK